MRYIDAKGKRISLVEWEMLLRNPNYGHVAYTDLGTYRVDTSWVGYVSELEETPGVFLTRVTKDELIRKKGEPDELPIWSTDEQAALLTHEAVLKVLKQQQK